MQLTKERYMKKFDDKITRALKVYHTETTLAVEKYRSAKDAIRWEEEAYQKKKIRKAIRKYEWEDFKSLYEYCNAKWGCSKHIVREVKLYDQEA